MRRMDKYLLCQEVEHYITESSSQDEAIQIQNASFNWEFRAPGEATETIILKEINLSVKKGEFIAVIGSVGSGKSSLLNALIENMKYIPLEVDSKVAVKGSIAYANQVAWVLNATIRDNILFGMTYDEEKYNRVLQICELENDLAILPGGDLTEIGEKGINLSGGQKARVSLARVIYSDADIMLLDDPMAAVDSHVGLSIFQKCLLDHCMFKTRILVTHGQHFLSKVDRVLFMNQGRIVDFGTFNELLSRCKQFNEYFTLELQKQESADAPPEPPPEELEQEDVEAKKAAEGRKQVNIIETEDRNTGRVSFDIYKIYFKYFGGPGPVIIALISMLLWQACEAAAGLYVTGWSEDSESNQLSNMHTYVLVYSLLQASSSLTIILRVCVIYNAGLRAAIIIFDKALDSLINAPINKFYDITPSGRIINRLSKDQDKADTQILFTIGNFIGMFFLAAFCVLISVIVDPYILLVVPIVVYLMYRIQNQYLTSARELTRLESVSRSPIIEHFSETITGSSTIRAFGHSKRFYERMKNVLDTNIRQFLSLEGTNTWLSLYLEFSGNIILIVSISVIILARGYISPGMAGLTFTWMIFLPEIIYSVILAQANIENQMVCVERLDALVKVHPESLRSRVKDNLLPDWPSEGQIEFKDYQMKYRDNTEIVLKGININIKPREKVGIVGRTGSGKSSIGMGLFRIVEALAGQIYIDGVNIAEIGLDLLRQRLSLIPQDPALFQGTMRENLDPFGTHSESELSTALSSIGLSLSLDKDITENGDNLSAGERQLVCIARAILRKSKVMLLDEATASIDLVLDEKIQEVIRKMFKDCTVLTIAHRINTIMDYDRIIVMDDGLVVEFDTPQALLDQKGVFWRLNEKFKSKQ